MTRRPHRPIVVALALAGTAAACGHDGTARDNPSSAGATTAPQPPATGSTAPSTAVIVPPDSGTYDPAIDLTDFVTAIDNPHLPFTTGSRWVYEGVADGDEEHTEVVVTDEQRTVMGIAVTVVRDTVSVDGDVVEDTYDWYAQDTTGNVWYFGEDVKNFDAGQLTSTDGSWEAGVDGALPGIVMLAEPVVGKAYRQEYWAGEAEDLAEVIAVGGRQDVPTGHYNDVVITRDWNPLEPDVIEEKQYAPGVGLIRETHVAGGNDETALAEFSPGP